MSRPGPFGIIENVNQPDGERERLTALGGLAALSLDALSSVAYGPEAILVVLVAAGASALRYSLPITGAIVVLLAALVISYRQVIEAFPNGGGAYAVSKRHLGMVPTLAFIAAMGVVIIGGLVRSHPDVALSHAMPSVTDSVGVLLILKAFASGCSALTEWRRSPTRFRSSGSRGRSGRSTPRCRSACCSA